MIRKLIPFLDVQAVSKLAKAHQFIAQVLQQGSSTWEKLVKRSCPFYEHKELTMEWYLDWELCYRVEGVEKRLKRQEINISHLTNILSKMENPKVPLLELLHVICERFPPMIFLPEENGRPMAFHLSCPCKRTHSVTPLGFLLLEKVEGSLKSAEQQVDTVFVRWLEGSFLSALKSRARRQQKSVSKVEAVRFVCYEEEDMEKLVSLQQNCQKLTFGEVEIHEGLDDEGYPRSYGQDFWAQLARALKLDDLGVDTVWATRNDLLGGRREDLRAIWDALTTDEDGYSSFHVTEVPFPVKHATIEQCWTSDEVKEKIWSDFQLILDKQPKQWPKKMKKVLEFSEEDSSSDGSVYF